MTHHGLASLARIAPVGGQGQHPGDRLLDGQLGRVDHHRIRGRLQRAWVRLLSLLSRRCRSVATAARSSRPPRRPRRPAPRSAGAGDRPVRSRRRSGRSSGRRPGRRPYRCPALHDHPAGAGQPPLPIQQEGNVRPGWPTPESTARVTALPRISEVTRSPSSTCSCRSAVVGDSNASAGSTAAIRGVVDRIDAGPQHRQGDDPVHRPGVQVAGVQRLGHPPATVDLPVPAGPSMAITKLELTARPPCTAARLDRVELAQGAGPLMTSCTGPIWVRTSRDTGRSTASSSRRTMCLRPSWMTTSTTAGCGAGPSHRTSRPWPDRPPARPRP